MSTSGSSGSSGVSASSGSSGGSSSGASASSSGSSSGNASTSSSSSSSGSGDGGSAGHLTPQQLVLAMAPGWNLGNTFDASPNETSWGNPETTQAMIQAVQTAGFNTMRIPVTWTDHIGAAPSYTIDPAWMAKVQQVATWATQAGMYAIVNTHHDADLQWVLFTDPGTTTTSLSSANQAQVTAEVTAVWTQIATAFQAFGDHLIFECFNEPHGNVNAYSGGNAAEQAILNSYLSACLGAIRGTGGNNATRYVMIQPLGASPVKTGVQALAIPSSDPNILISLHTYYPNGFSLKANPTTWGTTSADYTSMGTSLDQIRGWLPTQAIVIGEWGSMSTDQLSSRVAHAGAYAQDVRKAGMCPVWWDDGGNFALLNRKASPLSWSYPTIVSAIMSGVAAGAAPGATYAPFP
jgi:endoglucanase